MRLEAYKFGPLVNTIDSVIVIYVVVLKVR